MPDKTDILASLASLPADIKSLEELMIEKALKIEGILLKTALIELNTLEEVEAETDAEGKKSYSNESKRKAETDRRLLNNPTYSALSDEAKEFKRQLKLDEVMVRYKSRVFQATQSIVMILYSRS